MKDSFRYALRASVNRIVLVVFAAFTLVGCATPRYLDEFTATSKSGVKKVGVGIYGVNHSHQIISWFNLNSGVGGGNIPKRDPESGISCCVLLPEVWTSGLQVRVDWKISGIATIHSKTVPIERYEKTGSVYVHFFDNDEIRVVVTNVYSDQPHHPIPWVPEPCERTYGLGPYGHLRYMPGENCSPRNEE